MIRTNEVAQVAGIGPAHFRSAMAAAVKKCVYAAVIVTHYDRRCAAEAPANEIARCRNLRLVGEEYPAAIEDALQLGPEDLVLDEHVAANQPALRIDPVRCLGG
jgi:hypothetical protein